MLALKELQYLGHTQDGTIAERIPKLIDALLQSPNTEALRLMRNATFHYQKEFLAQR